MVIRGKAIAAVKEEQRRKKIKRLAVTCGLLITNLLIYTGVLALFAGLPSFAIREIHVEGTTPLREMEVKKFVQDELGKKALFIFPRDSAWLFPRTLAASVRAAFPWVATAEAYVEGRNAQLSLTEKKPAFISCNTETDGVRSCYYADNTGTVFAAAPAFSRPVYTEFVRTENQKPLTLGEVLVSREHAETIQTLVALLERQGVMLLSFVPRDAAYRAYTAAGWYVVFDPAQPVLQTAASIQTVLQVPEIQQSISSQPVKLEYIDVRLTDKVFYKQKETGTHATSTITF